MNLILPQPAVQAPSVSYRAPNDVAPSLMEASQQLFEALSKGTAIDAHLLRDAMESAFGGSDAEGAWSWKQAYEACELAQILFLRNFGAGMQAHAKTPEALLCFEFGAFATSLPCPGHAAPSFSSHTGTLEYGGR